MVDNSPGGEGFFMAEISQNVGILEPVTPAKPTPARPDLSGIKRVVGAGKFLQNFDAAKEGFEEGRNSTLTGELGGHGMSGFNGSLFDTESWRSSEENSRNQNSVAETGERLDIGNMQQKLIGVNANSENQGGNGSDCTNSHASQGRDGITDTGSGSGCDANQPQNPKKRKRKNNVTRTPRAKVKKHRPKIFDVMKPKKVAKSPKPKSVKKRKEAKKPKSEKKVKRPSNLKSANAPQDSSCTTDPQTPEPSATNRISLSIGSCRSLSNSEENGREVFVCCSEHATPSCKRALEYDLDFGQGASPIQDFSNKISVPQYNVYTRRRKMDFDLNLEVQDFEFCAELRKVVWETKNSPVMRKKRRMGRRQATTYPSFLETTQNLREILPTFKQFSAAIMEPKSFRCVLALQPVLLSRKKRSKRFKKVAAVGVRGPGSDCSAHLLSFAPATKSDNGTLSLLGGIQTKRALPSSSAFPRRKRSQINMRRRALPVSNLDFGSNLYEIQIKKSPLIDLNTLPGDFEEVLGVENQSSMMTLLESSEVEPQPTQELLPYEDHFLGSMLHFQGVKHTLMKEVTPNAESYHDMYLSISDNLKQTVVTCEQKELEHLSNSNKQIVMCDQSALITSNGKPRKKKRPELPKVIPDIEAMRTWILVKEDGREKTEEKYWKEQREIFCGRVQMFITRMHLIQGNRRFSRWKGSVVDSVIGVFLTQNVSDNMSSDAFMRFVARFPKHPDTNGRTEGIRFSLESVRDGDEHIIFSQESAGDGFEGIRLSQESVRDVDEDIIFSQELNRDGVEGIRFSQGSVRCGDEGTRSSQESVGSNTEHSCDPQIEKATNYPLIQAEGNKEHKVSGFEGATLDCDDFRKYEVPTPTLEEEVVINLEGKGKVSKKKNKEPEIQINWEELRKEYDTVSKDTTVDTKDSIDWEAVRCASAEEIAKTIGKRGMNNVLARIIKKFLNRLVEDHGKIDLEWLRNVPTEKVREYLLSFERIGLKSLDCVRLLTLHHHAFPVDTNVARIVVRLGWVPLQPLHGVEMHLLNDYPQLASIQEYLWPRLNALDQQTLYELHYQMITFGKVFCTKMKPRCNVCPMSRSCRHFASAQSAQFRLSSPEEKRNHDSDKHIGLKTPLERGNQVSDRHIVPLEVCLLDDNLPESQNFESKHNIEPLIEMPASPPPSKFWETEESDIEDLSWDSKRNSEEELFLNLSETARESHIASEALVLLAPEAASFPARKLRSTCRLHTEHEVYVLPDGHHLLAQFRKRETDDPVNYLFAIWPTDETTSIGNEADDQTVLGTILIPCRTANQGRFALNGTYFQVNEVFADYETSINPICVNRKLLWNLPRRVIYCAPSGRSIFRDMSLKEIHDCFWNGYICVRSFDRKTREPYGLVKRFHDPEELKDRRKKSEDKKMTDFENNSNKKVGSRSKKKTESKGRKKQDEAS